MAAAFSVSFDLMQQRTRDAPWMSLTSVLARIGTCARKTYRVHEQSMLTNGRYVLRAPDQHDLMAPRGTACHRNSILPPLHP